MTDLNQNSNPADEATPQTDWESTPGLWEVLGSIEEISVTPGFADRVVQAARPARRILSFRRLVPVAAAASVLLFVLWWAQRDSEVVAPVAPEAGSSGAVANEIEALLGEGLDDDEYLAQEVDGLALENREWFGS